MKVNNQAFKLAGVTEKDYNDWCDENKKARYLPQTKREFFTRIRDGRLVKDKEGKLIKKRKKSVTSR